MLGVFLVLGFQHLSLAQPADYEFICGSEGIVAAPQGDGSENTICDDPSDVRYIRMALHYLLRESNWVETITDNCSGSTPPYSFTYVGPGNFTETNDGVGNPNYNGFQHAENMINLANQMLANNEDHWRKESGVYYPPQSPDIIFITRSQ